MEALTKTEQRALKSVLKNEIDRLQRAIIHCEVTKFDDNHVKKMKTKVEQYNKIISKFDI